MLFATSSWKPAWYASRRQSARMPTFDIRNSMPSAKDWRMVSLASFNLPCAMSPSVRSRIACPPEEIFMRPCNFSPPSGASFEVPFPGVFSFCLSADFVFFPFPLRSSLPVESMLNSFAPAVMKDPLLRFLNIGGTRIPAFSTAARVSGPQPAASPKANILPIISQLC